MDKLFAPYLYTFLSPNKGQPVNNGQNARPNVSIIGGSTVLLIVYGRVNHLLLLVFGLLHLPLHLFHCPSLRLLSPPELPRLLQRRHRHTVTVSAPQTDCQLYQTLAEIFYLVPGLFQTLPDLGLPRGALSLPGFMTRDEDKDATWGAGTN